MTPDLDDDFAGPDLTADGLRLRIDAVQPDWRPEDPPSPARRARRPDRRGSAAARDADHGSGRGDDDRLDRPRVHEAAWLVGTEHLSARDSAEICLFEIDAEAVGETASRARTGVKAHHDDRVTTDMTEVDVPGTAGRPSTWSAEWDADRVVLACDGVVAHEVAPGMAQPMVLLVDLFETGAPSPAAAYPKTALVHRVRGRGAGKPDAAAGHRGS